MYVYIKSEQGLWTVGFYDPQTGVWVAETDHDTKDKAAERVHYLNGGGEGLRIANALECIGMVLRDRG